MTSKAIQAFEHAIQDSTELLGHFDSLNKQPPTSAAEVLKRASLVMALAALETYIEDQRRRLYWIRFPPAVHLCLQMIGPSWVAAEDHSSIANDNFGAVEQWE